MTVADSESGRGGMAGAVEDAALVVVAGAVMAFEVAGREAPGVVAIGAVKVATRKRSH